MSLGWSCLTPSLLSVFSMWLEMCCLLLLSQYLLLAAMPFGLFLSWTCKSKINTFFSTFLWAMVFDHSSRNAFLPEAALSAFFSPQS